MNNYQTGDAEMNWSRRKFVVSLAVAGGVSTFLLRDAASAADSTWVSVGTTDTFKPGQVQKMSVRGTNLYLACNQDNSIAALSPKCTHMGCTVALDLSRNQFAFPCHGGRFDQTGKNVSGPPQRPLDHYEVRIDKDKTVYVKIPE